MKRVVIDTNIFISATFWKGTPGRVIEVFTSQQAVLLLSDDILDELTRKLKSAKFAARILAIEQTPEQIVDNFRSLAEIVVSADVSEDAVRDSKDLIILACATGGKADYIVSGDKDLTDLDVYAGIPIVTPAQFLSILFPPTETADEPRNE